MKYAISILIINIMFANGIAQKNVISMEDLLQRYQETFISEYPTLSYKIESKTILSKSHPNSVSEEEIYNMVVHQDNELMDVTVEKKFLPYDRRYLSRGVITNHSINFTKFQDGAMDFVTVTANPQSILEKRRAWAGYKSLGVVLDGRVWGSDQKIQEVLSRERDLHYSATEELLDGKSVILATFETQYGNIKLWLDSEAGYCPRKIVLEKNAGDLHFANVIGQNPNPMPEGVKKFFPNKTKNNLILTAYPIEIDKVAGRYFPVSATIIEQITYEGGETSTMKCSIIQKDIDLNPDFKKIGAFELQPNEIPDGTRVFFDDERGTSGVEYEWFNGEVRAKIDNSFLDLLNSEIMQIKHPELPLTKNSKSVQTCDQNELPQIDVRDEFSADNQQERHSNISINPFFLISLSIAIALLGFITAAWLFSRRRA